MNNMAVASRSPADARDARVPCAQCGGLGHPIAGRCKHCKADLAAARTAHAPALAVLPPLANPTSAPAPAKPLPQIAAPAPLAVPPNAETLVGATPVVMASAVPSIVVATAPAREAYNPMPDGRPILPPRPTGRMRARGDERGWLARNWPVIVIVLASIAIILAVILMVWPKKDAVDVGTRNGAAGPAPERMETNPLPPSSSDPWQNGQPPSADPQPQQAPTPPPDPDPDTTMIDPNDPLKDPFNNGGGLGAGRDQIGMTLLGNIANRLCDKAKTCSDPTVASMCSAVTTFPVSPIPATCPQAKRCMEMIDQIDVCDGGLNGGLGGPNFPQLMMKTSDCMDALTHC